MVFMVFFLMMYSKFCWVRIEKPIKQYLYQLSSLKVFGRLLFLAFLSLKKKEPPGNSAIKRPFWHAKKNVTRTQMVIGDRPPTEASWVTAGSSTGSLYMGCLKFLPGTQNNPCFLKHPPFFLKMVLIYRKSSNWNVAIRVFVEFFWIYWVGICYQP